MRVLVLTHRLPYAPNRGDRIRAYHLIRSIAEYADVDLVSFVHDKEEARHIPDLQPVAHVTGVPIPRWRNAVRGILTLPGSRPLTHALLDSPDMPRVLQAIMASQPPDVVLAYCSGMARFAVEGPLAGRPFVLDLVDVDSEKWGQLAGTSRGPRRMIYGREAATLRRFERAAAYRAYATLVVNEKESDSLSALAPGCNVRIVPNGVDLETFTNPDPVGRSSNVVFCGVMDYAPNVAAVVWFARNVWPLIKERWTDARFQVVGSSPSRVVRALSADSSIEITGTVSRVQPYLWNAAVSVAPLRVARGVQNKVLEALAAGVPAVVSTTVLQGLPTAVRGACLAAEDPQEMADAVLSVLAMSVDDRRSLAARADLQTVSWTRRLAEVRSVLEGAVPGAVQAHEPALLHNCPPRM
jgi:sugar transferase (PEP-CTERM/EpsH1 system associated)